MKKFVILFLLLITLSFTILSSQAAETIIPEEIIPEIVLDQPDFSFMSQAETFAVDVEIPVIVVEELPSEEDLRCLQANIYFEARNQGVAGMQAVANVTINRSKDPRYPSTLCGVVQQRYKGVCQFSWFCNAKLRAGPRLVKEAERRAWELAGEIAMKVVTGVYNDIVRGATHFHTTAIRPRWARNLDKTVKIGSHIFYR